MPFPPRSPRTRLMWLALAAILGLAGWLRLQQISGQWLTDDEWHAVHQIVHGRSYADLASTVGGADFSIPQALAYKYLAAHGGLNELGMRLPMLVAGLLLVGGGAAWAWRRFGPVAGTCFGLLLAISPLLVNFSRTARPYALTVLLSWLALVALLRWRDHRQVRWAACHATSALLACWLHMAVAPFVLAPLGWVVLAEVREAWRTAQPKRAAPVMALALTVAFGLGILALRPIWVGRTELASRLGSDLPNLDTYVGVWHTWLGTDSAIIVVVALLFALVGVRTLARAAPRLLGMAALGLAATLASIYVLRPAWVFNALTFGRYLLPAQTLLLACIALGMARLLEHVPRPGLRAAGAVVLPALFLIGTPHPDLLRRPNNFTLHLWYQFDYREAHNPVRAKLGQRAVDPFWRRFADAAPGSLRLAVAGHGLESFTIPDVRWQELHRQRVLNAQLSGFCAEPYNYGEALPRDGFFLRNAVTLADPGDLARKRVDYVIFDRRGERDVESCIARFRRENGAPEYEDPGLIAFRVSRGH